MRALGLPRLRRARPPSHETDKPNEEEAEEEAKEEDGWCGEGGDAKILLVTTSNYLLVTTSKNY